MRLCGAPYTTGRWCSLAPYHSQPHEGDMGPHVLTREARLAYEFGAEVSQTRAACSCGWRSSWFTGALYLGDPERRHLAEVTRR